MKRKQNDKHLQQKVARALKSNPLAPKKHIAQLLGISNLKMQKICKDIGIVPTRRSVRNRDFIEMNESM